MAKKKTVQERILRQLICMGAVLAEIRESLERLANAQGPAVYGPPPRVDTLLPDAKGIEVLDPEFKKLKEAPPPWNPQAKKGGA